MKETEYRIASVEEFKKLWNYSESNTYKYFLNLLENNQIELWTAVISDELIAELYIFWDSPDKDEANNKNRAYLCAFRVRKDYQGLGIGTTLMTKVFNRIKSKGFNEVTIGIDNDNYLKLLSMYKRFGFNVFVKSTYIDLHYLNKNNQPTEYKEPYELYLSKL